MFSNPRTMASQYRRVDLETGVATNDPHRLIAMLFDGLLDRIGQARDALGTGNVAIKSQAIGRATRILDEGLKASLDMRAGGDLSEKLSVLYGYCCMRLMQANLEGDAGALDEVQRLIAPLRDAWQAIGPQAAARPAAVAAPAALVARPAAATARAAYAA